MKIQIFLLVGLALFQAAGCTGSDAVLVTNSLLAANAAVNPPIMRAVDGIPGWKRTGPPERFNKESLYGYIDGGAEIVLQYGFRELSVFKFKRAVAVADTDKELVLEIYRMATGPAAFGLYSTKVEGGERSWPGIRSDHWIVPGQANLVKGEYLVNILAPACADREIGEFAAALERKVPGRRTVRPKSMDGLPGEGMIAASGRFIKGSLAAQNESPFLDAPFWGFGGTGEGATVAYSAKYGVAPSISKLVIVRLGTAVMSGSLEDGLRALFNEYLKDVRVEGGVLEGRNEAGRWFLFKAKGAIAVLALGDPDREAALRRLDAAVSRASR